MIDTPPDLTVVMPARDEAAALGGVIDAVKQALEPLGRTYEVLVVDDGSTDGTDNVARHHGARVHRHPRGLGNGAAVKAGLRHARGRFVALLDADGQHDPADLPRLLDGLGDDYAMAVGARTGGWGGGPHRALANVVYATLATWVSGHRVPDLTSGYRVIRTADARKFLYMLPNTFSYPTTLTMAFLRSGRPVRFVDITARRRTGKSKIRLFRDGVRFLLIILRVATMFSPLRVFLPASLLIAGAGAAVYGWYWAQEGAPRLTNGIQLLWVLGSLVFFLGLLAEQIAALRFDRSEDEA